MQMAVSSELILFSSSLIFKTGSYVVQVGLKLYLCAAQAGLELPRLPLAPPECWDSRDAPPPTLGSCLNLCDNRSALMRFSAWLLCAEVCGKADMFKSA